MSIFPPTATDCLLLRRPGPLAYAERRAVGRGESIAPLVLPAVALAVESLSDAARLTE